MLFWIVAAVLLLVVIPFAVAGGVGMALFILGLVAMLTGLYTLLFKRRSWIGLPHRNSGGVLAVSGFVALILSFGLIGATAPRVDSDKATLVGPVQQSETAKATATPTPTPTATNPANSKCTTAAATQKYNSQTLICTMGSDQRLVWMTEPDSQRVLAEKAAADKASDEKAAAEKAAAEQAAAERAAAEKAAADKAASEQAAAKAEAGTVSQRNALRAAADYLDYTAFSRTGLISQLEYEEYSTEDATWAVDRVKVDWNVQAVKSAKDYLDYTAFSRAGLIDQLIYEGFTPEQAEYGVSQTGL
ncbi:Ltp family lipoprotein [Pseudarthrobacter sulfonivorans]|uniref:Ltp family lipoprotein n=1 Tax=Pseudarthrobacter sulfonivorans TaxID=121292 RepID=UPI001F0A8B97|nr:Ltp family lipoprotein [Pseudarthrobacter sulfonivorans]